MSIARIQAFSTHRSKREPQVTGQIVEPLELSHVAMLLPNTLHAAEMRHGEPPGLGRAHAQGNVFFGLEIDVEADLLS